MATKSINASGLLGSLHPREIQKLEKLAAASGEPFDDAFFVTAVRNLIKIVPNSIKNIHLVTDSVIDMIESIHRDGAHVVLTLQDGTRLKTFQSRQQYRNYYYCFRHKLPAYFSPESYQACHDVRFRYLRGNDVIRDLTRIGLLRDSESRNIIECGAYNGWKALGFAKYLGPNGKLIVIEIDREQYKLAKWNLDANLAKDRFIALNFGVWNCVEERQYSYGHYASHTLKTPDEHAHHSQQGRIVTDTLDHIIDESGVDIFDFVNVQTGGSELESVQGLVKNLNRVKVLWMGTHYAHEGVSIRYKCIDYLLQQGCRVYGKIPDADLLYEVTSIQQVDKSDIGGFWAVSPAFRDENIPRTVPP